MTQKSIIFEITTNKMPDSYPIENEFLKKITALSEENISDEQFGVSELAHAVGMSRSNLLRKVKKLTGKSASMFIREVRLKRAMEMLRQDSWNVSEVSFKVGFSSTSYFIKCFRDHFGYPPGEVGKSKLIGDAAVPMDQPTRSHQLADIMFTDIRDYTALMQRDEEKAIEFRDRHREVFNAITKKHKGKILQYYGDGTLSTFSSAIDAVRCGIEMQLAFQEEPRIPVRVGVHTGDIIFTEDDIIGDGVNIAARVESLAVAGSVFISEKVFDEVKNQPGIQCKSMGVFKLKNVDKPIEVFAISNPGLIVPDKEQIAGKEDKKTQDDIGKPRRGNKIRMWWYLIPLIVVIIIFIVYNLNIFDRSTEHEETIHRESIAVLPFINDSQDSSNVYIINGLMESVLNNLQKIEGLRVISRTSVEKFRKIPKTIPEIAEELNVHYIVEGSGQKIGDQILLNIQLIEGQSDKHLWSEQYNREAKDIFELQLDIAKKIADKIEVIITPEEEERINKIPTDNLVAYDYFLKGLDLFYEGSYDGLESAIVYFKKAIEQDSLFARAYADIAISYFFLDAGHTEKQYTDLLNSYADNALLYDPQLPQSLIAKALFYMQNREYDLAIPYLEKALEYNPNSALVVNALSDFYANYVPNTEKYLQYALKGIQLDIAAQDSSTASVTYLHISNAFIQTGFVEEAEKYIDMSLAYYPNNLYSVYVKAYILYAKDRDLNKLKDSLIEALKRDTTRLDILQELAKSYYYLRDYEKSYTYYKKLLDVKEAYQLDIYRGENAKIGLVMDKMGLGEQSEKLFAEYKIMADNDKSIYKHLSLSAYHSFHGNTETAIEQFRLFSQQDNYPYWIVIFIGMDPLFDPVKEQAGFKKVLEDIESKFWNSHQEIKTSLEENDLL